VPGVKKVMLTFSSAPEDQVLRNTARETDQWW
jgi:hypothetical protein